MALDATVGSPNANSYVTLDEADTYYADRAHAEKWSEAVNKSSLLVTASLQLDWYVTWKGSRATNEQSMDWPRVGVYNDLGIEYPDNEIPTKVKVAVFELTLVSLDLDRTSDNPLTGLSEVRAASLMIKTDSNLHSAKFEVIPDKIWKILDGLTIKEGIGVVRLIRA